jgi:hypothetical protein
MDSSRPIATPALHVFPEAASPCGESATGRYSRRLLYRPLILGPVLMVRSSSHGRWTVEVSDDRRLLPRLGSDWEAIGRDMAWYRAQGVACRVAAALVIPGDAEEVAWRRPRSGRESLSLSATRRAAGTRGQRPLEMYGWSLLIQPRGMRGVAIIDAHDQLADLPAFFELPHELLDRTEYLEAHGVTSRPIALVTASADFARGADGRLRNRFAPAARIEAVWGD